MDRTAEFLEERREWIEFANRYGRSAAPVSEPGSLETLGPWVKCPSAAHCWLRTREGGDPAVLADRRVFVEKTPRVFDPTLGLPIDNCYSWIQGSKGDADEGDGPDMSSRAWADGMACALGYCIATGGES